MTDELDEGEVVPIGEDGSVALVDEHDTSARARGDASLSAGETWLEPWHVAVFLSKRRSGKSTLACVLTGMMRRQTIVFLDVKRRYRVHEAVVCQGAAQLAAALASRPRPRRIHFLATAVDGPGRRTAVEQEWNEVFGLCFAETDVTVQADECVPWPLPATGTPGMAVTYLMQGAVNRDGLVACTGRWRGVSLDLKAQANVIGIFPGGLSADELTEAAQEMGGDLAEAAQELGCTARKPLDQLRYLLAKAAEVGPYACLWYDRDRGLFRIFQLPDHVLDQALATEIAPR